MASDADTITQLKAENEALRSEIAALLAAGFTAEDDPMPLKDLAWSASEQIQSAVERLPAHGLRLGPVAMRLRGAWSNTGSDLALCFTRTDNDALGELVLGFLPNRSGALAGTGLIPDVLGYTEALATRKLEAAGCAVEVYKSAGAPTESKDRVLRQRPEAGEAVVAGTVVQVWIGM